MKKTTYSFKFQVGGNISDIVYSKLRSYGRVLICGLISTYNTGAEKGKAFQTGVMLDSWNSFSQKKKYNDLQSELFPAKLYRHTIIFINVVLLLCCKKIKKIFF